MEDQKTIWNGAAGHAWVDNKNILDELFRPFEKILVDTARAQNATNILDIGCGTGAITMALARDARCTGIDISEPMIAAARAQATRAADFICADAETYPFEPATFDLVVSRFGVMFFADPVKAFSNILRASRPDAHLHLIAFRGAAENPFMTTAERAANLPPRPTDGPGQFAFADPHRVESILEDSGWSSVEITPLDVECSFHEKDLRAYVTRLGPVGRILEANPDEELLDKILPAFDPYKQGSSIRFTAACWSITARRH